MLERGMAALAAALLLGTVQAQPVNKGLDAQGRTRYGLQQPSGLDAAPQPRALPRDVQAEVEDMTRGPLKTPPGPSKLSCAVAVGRITHGLDSMLETREQNMRDGYLTCEAFEATAREIRSARGHATMADCESATGAKRDFYQCMSSNAGHVMACAQQHRF